VTIANSTISGNQANVGGGVFNFSGGTVNFNRSLVSGNTADSFGKEVYNGGTINADNYNLFGHSGLSNGQSFIGFTPGATDINATSDGSNPTALAGILDTTLQNNGGDTATHALVSGSPAMDASPNDAACSDPPISGLDQRGVSRPQGSACDIGAFELEQEPTAITLASFEVQANDGRAIILWETATEIDNAGFNIYRATSPDGPWLQANSLLIAANGDPVSGASYTFVDTPGRGTFYYRLEDIDFFGLSTLHQPTLVEMGAIIRRPWFRPILPPF